MFWPIFILAISIFVFSISLFFFFGRRRKEHVKAKEEKKDKVDEQKKERTREEEKKIEKEKKESPEKEKKKPRVRENIDQAARSATQGKKVPPAVDHAKPKTSSPETPKKSPIKKIDLKDGSSLIGDKGLLYSYCEENSKRLYIHRIKSMGQSIKYMRDNPDFAERVVSKINGLDPQNYERALDVTIAQFDKNPKSIELRAIRDTLLACVYMSGANKWRDSFLKQERVFDSQKNGFIDQIKDDLLKEHFKELAKTSSKQTESLERRANSNLELEEIIDGAIVRRDAPEALKALTAAPAKKVQRGAA